MTKLNYSKICKAICSNERLPRRVKKAILGTGFEAVIRTKFYMGYKASSFISELLLSSDQCEKLGYKTTGANDLKI